MVCGHTLERVLHGTVCVNSVHSCRQLLLALTHHFARLPLTHQLPHLPHQLHQQRLTWSHCALHEINHKLAVTDDYGFVAGIETWLCCQLAQAIHQPLCLCCIVSDPLQTIKSTRSPQVAATCVPGDEPSHTLLLISQLPAPPVES